MTSLLRKFMPISTSKIDDDQDDDDEYSVEYSFAIEYSGPPVSYDIPHVLPVDVETIPTAAVVSSDSLLNNLSLPVVQPIVKKESSGEKPAKRSKLVGAEVAESSDSGRISAEFGGSNRDFVVVNHQEGLPVPDGSEHSSGTLGFSESPIESNEISGSSDIEDLKDESGMGIGSSDQRGGLGNSLVNDDSSDNSICEELEDYALETSSVVSISEVVENGADNETFYQENRTSVVTFVEPESSNATSEDGYTDELDDDVERPVARTDLKKGVCHRCLKGNRFTEKEVCIVCGAKYCGNCVLRAMGSMQEGRKCVTCIGFSILESKRGYLGKSSKLLKKLLTEWEIKEVMRNELSCEANQIPPRLVHINRRPLSLQELVQLQSCRIPPKKIKPGRYWYDRVSGYWGKEGHPPCQIISPLMDIGGTIERDASNGNTNVLINGREITKKELWMLQMAGIHCEGQPHFWLSEDGSYQHEGQRNVMGKLWDKPRIKFVCAALSLPFPSEVCSGELRMEVANGGVSHLDEKVVRKLFLVGCDQSGTSTIFKQAKILYNVPFTEDEREHLKLLIQTSLYYYIGILLEARERFEEDCLRELRRQHLSEPGPSAYAEQIEERNAYSMAPKLKAFSDWLLKVMMAGNLEAIFPAATREYARTVEDLMKDNGFLAAYSRRNELDMLPRVANYFLDRAVDISRADYEPSNMDILYAEGITSSNGVASMEFSFPVSSSEGYMESVDQTDASISCSYQLIRVHSSHLGENCKWLEMFEDVDMVIFCVSLTDYDKYLVNSEGVCINKMLASKKLLENIVSHPSFADKDFLLLLNKFDLLEEKLEQVPLSECEWFPDFRPVMSNNPHKSTSSNNPPLAQRAYHYIAAKFKRMFESLTDKKLYVFPVSGLEANSVDGALKYSREILKWEEERPRFCRSEFSSESIEASSSS
ncbi:OLC1v1003090C1 [Oldenlandia corymbosa var. corymbosa]|uniref:OLC1v1003090C1 n=1 Tax=Oldenlandia corymbosa var. corymbosa TaxID=529605 RepID=A0AAV1D994_OLDCO|nr:OLC1v1003090C1 [Oldenlandia corymbosa var. corymbosa]